MKTIRDVAEQDNEMLLYDADCPLCKWYTQKFVDCELLPEQGRVPYTKMGPYVQQQIDVKRAKNEIALYNKTTGETLYGVQSLVALLSKKWKWIGKTFKFKVVEFLLSQLYSFISYNRKIIIPAVKSEGFLACFPEPKPASRITFIVLCMIGVNAIVGYYFHTQLNAYGHWYYPCREMVFFAGQLVFQGLIFLLFRIKNYYDYAGHVSFISFKGAMLLGLFALVNITLSQLNIDVSLFQPFFFGAVFMFMFLEHRRVSELMSFPKFLTYTWLLFRIAIYPLAFKV